MGARESLRGYLVQTMASLLQALLDEEWKAVSLEPMHESEKVDVKWKYPDHVRVVQIKSSQNPFRPNQIKSWCTELADSTQADQYELILVGTLGSKSGKPLKTFKNVNIPAPIPLNVERILKEISYDLSAYCDRKELPLLRPEVWHLLACGLIFQLEVESIYGQWFTRENFDKLLQKWILIILPKIKDLRSDVSVETVRDTVLRQTFEPEPWIQPLKVNKLGSPSNESTILHSALKEDKKIILVGGSGSGKTYLLRTIAAEINNNLDQICFWIPLVVYTHSLDRTIRRQLGWYEIEDDNVIPTLEKHEAVLILDGLNEVIEEKREQCAREIQQLLHTYQARICISYHLSDHSVFGFDCVVYKISSLLTVQIENAIKTFFLTRGEPEKASWFLQSVRGLQVEQQQDFFALAQLPIHLGFILELVTASDFRFSSLRDLYGQVIQNRLERTKRKEQRGTIPVDTKILLLMDLAYRSISEDLPLQLQKTSIQSIFAELLTSLSEAALALEEIVRASLLVEVNGFLVEWPHSSFRDYLAGRQLFAYVDREEQFDNFPIEKTSSSAAVAHAVKLATKESRRLEKRPTIFLALIEKQPTFETLKIAAEEYHPPWDYYTATNQTLEVDETKFREIQWGERFVSAYQKILRVVTQDKPSDVDRMPSPVGLRIFLDSEAEICAIIFSQDQGIYFDQLQNFEGWILQSKQQSKSVFGFCLFAPFLLLLDPEIVAYLQVGVWLRMGQDDIKNKWGEWHNGLATYLTTRNEWISWGIPRTVPEPEFELCASPRETFFALRKRYGPAQADQIGSLSFVGKKARNELLTWEEIYAPITFKIFPNEIESQSQLSTNRHSEWMLLTPPSYDISLVLLMPWNNKIDNGVNIFLPFPIASLDGYYFHKHSYSSDLPRLYFVNLLGKTGV